MGDFEADALCVGGVNGEIPSLYMFCSYIDRYPVSKQCLMGSLTGAVASQRVAEAFKGWLGTDGNRTGSVYA